MRTRNNAPEQSQPLRMHGKDLGRFLSRIWATSVGSHESLQNLGLRVACGFKLLGSYKVIDKDFADALLHVVVKLSLADALLVSKTVTVLW